MGIRHVKRLAAARIAKGHSTDMTHESAGRDVIAALEDDDTGASRPTMYIPGIERESASAHLISSAQLYTSASGAHDIVRLWSRGGLGGDLVMTSGDGARLLFALGLFESKP